MTSFIQDVRFGARILIQRPAFTALAVLTLALGIGATTAMFSVVYGVLLRPLPYPEPDALVKINGIRLRDGSLPTNLSRPDFKDFERLAQSFASMGAHGAGVGAFTLTGDGEPERVPAVNVSGGFFPTLGATAAVGRLFTLSDDRAEPAEIVVITHGLWQRRFGGRADIVGQSMTINGRPYEIAGVLERTFRFPQPEPDREPQVYGLFGFGPEFSRSGRHIRAIGRLRADVTPREGQADLSTIAAQLEREYPQTNYQAGVLVRTLDAAIMGESRRPLLMLLSAVGLVLVIACANLANLLLARGATRQREIAIRGAIGAGRARIARQLLAESLVLGALGGTLGLALAWNSVEVLASLGAASIPRAADIGIDWRVLAFAALVTLGTVLLFGIAPIVQATAVDLHAGLRGGREGGTAVHGRLRGGLIAVEVALAVVLLVGAGLVGQAFARLIRTDTGFAPAQVLTLQLSLPTARYAEGTQINFYEQLYERLAVLPGVEGVGAVNILPFSGNYSCDGFQIVGRIVPDGQQPCAETRSVSLEYFQTLGVPLLGGRTFEASDHAGAPAVVVVNEAMARQHFPGQDAVGQSIVYGEVERRILGVVGSMRHFGLDREAVPEFYLPQRQQPSYHTMTLTLRLARGFESSSLTPSVRREVAAMDPQLPLYNVHTMSSLISRSVAEPRFRILVLGTFAGLSWLLALVGVYGVITYLVGQRAREIGIRIALGATRRDVARLVVWQGMRPVGVGMAIGLAAAVPTAMFASRAIAGVNPFEPVTFAAVPLGLVLAALLATWLPARKAMRIQPVEVLR